MESLEQRGPLLPLGVLQGPRQEVFIVAFHPRPPDQVLQGMEVLI